MAAGNVRAVVRKRYAAKTNALKAFIYKVLRIRWSNPSWVQQKTSWIPNLLDRPGFLWVSSAFSYFSLATVYYGFCLILREPCCYVATQTTRVAKSMGSITVRKRKDGSAAYTAQIRIMQKDVTVYQESQTFDRKTTTQAWLKRHEAELAEPGAIAKAQRKGVTVKEMIEPPRPPVSGVPRALMPVTLVRSCRN
ncbi:hypothetical protein D3C86_738410 [compost metagenome]